MSTPSKLISSLNVYPYYNKYKMVEVINKDGFVVDPRYFKRFLAKINFIFMLYQTDSKMIRHESFI